MQILSKFCHNKHLTHEMAPLRINTTDAYSYRQLSTPTNALLFNSATFIKKKQVTIHKNIIINSKANKYQHNYKQTISP